MRVFDAFDDDDDAEVKIIMEPVHGDDLYDTLGKLPGSFAEDTARTIVRDVARALQYIHARGIMHRDIKLQNIMMETVHGSDGVVAKVTGVAVCASTDVAVDVTEKGARAASVRVVVGDECSFVCGGFYV